MNSDLANLTIDELESLMAACYDEIKAREQQRDIQMLALLRSHTDSRSKLKLKVSNYGTGNDLREFIVLKMPPRYNSECREKNDVLVRTDDGDESYAHIWEFEEEKS